VDATGGRKARPYEIWDVIQVVFINRRRTDRLYARSFGNLNAARQQH